MTDWESVDLAGDERCVGVRDESPQIVCPSIEELEDRGAGGIVVSEVDGVDPVLVRSLTQVDVEAVSRFAVPHDAGIAGEREQHPAAHRFGLGRVILVGVEEIGFDK